MIHTLRDAQDWHESARRLARLFERLIDRYWNEDSADKTLRETIFADREFRAAEGAESLQKLTKTVLKELDDLSVFLLFSVFEAEVRKRALEELRQLTPPRHPILDKLFSDAMEEAENGSLKRMTDSYGRNDVDLRAQVDQIREYRNWVAHGRSGKPGNNVKPSHALERLARFLGMIDSPPPPDPS